MIELEGLEVAGLFLFLKDNENGIDLCLKKLTDRIECYLYDRLSIQEMEELGVLYKKHDEDLKSKI